MGDHIAGLSRLERPTITTARYTGNTLRDPTVYKAMTNDEPMTTVSIVSSGKAP